jgi:hypothetical protein
MNNERTMLLLVTGAVPVLLHVMLFSGIGYGLRVYRYAPRVVITWSTP